MLIGIFLLMSSCSFKIACQRSTFPQLLVRYRLLVPLALASLKGVTPISTDVNKISVWRREICRDVIATKWHGRALDAAGRGITLDT